MNQMRSVGASATTQRSSSSKTTAATPSDEEKPIEHVLSYPILLLERVRAAVDEADSFKVECSEIGEQSNRLCQMLRSAVRLWTSTGGSLYERPVRRIVSEVLKNLELALSLVRKCKRRSVIYRVMTIVSAADFRKVRNLLESSVGDMKWLLSIFDYADAGSGAVTGGGIVFSLPPIASNDPIISWVWSFIGSLHMGQLNDKIEAANQLTLLAQDNDRNKKIIVEEGSIAPLLKLLKESYSPEVQMAAAFALHNLCNNDERVSVIINEVGVPVIVQVLGDSPVRVQIHLASLVAVMAEHSSIAQEVFARENVIRPLVTLLSFDMFMDSIDSIVQINKEMEKKSVYNRPELASSKSMKYLEGSSRVVNHRKDRENEKPEVKLLLKISCAKALWMLARGSIANSRRITETKGLLCLVKLIEKEEGELQMNCLEAIMEITAVAESNADLRRAAFKTNSPAAKAVVDQLSSMIEQSHHPKFQITAIKSIGHLARTFPARKTKVIGLLVNQLNNQNLNLATEAAIALGKFASPENYLCVEHSKTIVDFNAVPPLLWMLRVRGHERAQLHGLILLLSYLALHAANDEFPEQATVLNVLEKVDRTPFSDHLELKELISRALFHLKCHSRVLPQRPLYAP